MSDEIEDALRRELTGRLVPFDEGRAEDMIRAAAEAGLANAPRAWVAPLAAAAAVVVVGGGVALATAGGGGSSASGPEQPGGPGVSASDGANSGPCAPFGSDASDIGVAVEASGEPDGSGLASAPTIYTAVNEESSAVMPPYPPTVSPTSEAPVTATDLPLRTASEVPFGSDSEVPAGTLRAVPPSGASSGPVDLTPSGRTVICLVSPATPMELGSASCTKGHHSVTCVSVGYCTAPEDNPPTPPASSDGADNSVLCVDEGSGSFAPLPPPTVSGSEEDQPGTVGADTGTMSFTVQTDVLAGQRGGHAYVPDIPDGYQLDVTELTLRNPAADQGTITIGAGDTTILRDNLADIRNHNYHFTDQPIIYTSGTPVVVGVNCVNSGDNCTPAVDVTGHLEPVR